jgi:hypothetical protein
MKKTNDQPLTKLANAAFRQAAKKVIERAEQTGTPVIVWEDEAVKELEPQAERLDSRQKNGSK